MAHKISVSINDVVLDEYDWIATLLILLHHYNDDNKSLRDWE